MIYIRKKKNQLGFSWHKIGIGYLFFDSSRNSKCVYFFVFCFFFRGNVIDASCGLNPEPARTGHPWLQNKRTQRAPKST